jgi:hypothetical protein
MISRPLPTCRNALSGIFVFPSCNRVAAHYERRGCVSMPLSPPLRVEDFAGIFCFSSRTRSRRSASRRWSQCPRSPLNVVKRRGHFCFSFSGLPAWQTASSCCLNAPFPSAARRGLREHFCFSFSARRQSITRPLHQTPTSEGCRNAPSGIFVFPSPVRRGLRTERR